jgi:hypothetical protein
LLDRLGRDILLMTEMQAVVKEEENKIKFCCACNSTKTASKTKDGSQFWYKGTNEGEYLCKKCYERIRMSKKSSLSVEAVIQKIKKGGVLTTADSSATSSTINTNTTISTLDNTPSVTTFEQRSNQWKANYKRNHRKM